jgi:hypothetical protein
MGNRSSLLVFIDVLNGQDTLQCCGDYLTRWKNPGISHVGWWNRKGQADTDQRFIK